MLKRRLVSKLFFLFLLFFYFPVVIANIDIKQGDNISSSFLSSIHIGMNKNEVFKLFGTPVLLPNCEYDCLCYYHYTLPIRSNKKIRYNYILMFFDKSVLVSYIFKK